MKPCVLALRAVRNRHSRDEQQTVAAQLTGMFTCSWHTRPHMHHLQTPSLYSCVEASLPPIPLLTHIHAHPAPAHASAQPTPLPHVRCSPNAPEHAAPLPPDLHCRLESRLCCSPLLWADQLCPAPQRREFLQLLVPLRCQLLHLGFKLCCCHAGLPRPNLCNTSSPSVKGV